MKKIFSFSLLSISLFLAACSTSKMIRIPATGAVTNQINPLTCNQSSASHSNHFLLEPRPAGAAEHPGLSTYWFQEYTGGDLVRELLLEQGAALPDPGNYFDVVDIDHNSHGEKVSGLIAGPHLTAMLPRAQNQTPYNHPDSYDNRAYAESGYRHYQQSLGNRKPPFVSNSMNWQNSQSIYETVATMNTTGTIFVTTAGNEGQDVEPLMERAAQELGTVVVGSLNSRGSANNSSQIGRAVTLLAPSGSELTTYDRQGRIHGFGGTSGATPQVTAALVAFELLSGFHPTGSQARRLLEKTATRAPHSHMASKRHGAGVLNAYALTQVALRLKQICASSRDQRNCLSRALEDNRNYIFPAPDLQPYQATFPECFSGLNPTNSSLTCQEKKLALKQLRKEALLHPTRESLQLLSCIHRGMRLSSNAFYYKLLAESQTQADYISWAQRQLERIESADLPVDERVIVAELLSQDPAHPEWVAAMISRRFELGVVGIALTKSHWRGHPALLQQLIDTGQEDNYIAMQIFSRRHWAEHPELYRRLLDRGSVRDQMLRALRAPYWVEYPNEFLQIATHSAFDRASILDLLDTLPHWQGTELASRMKQALAAGQNRIN